jgi:integrase
LYIKRLKNDRKHIEIITVEELGKLFSSGWQRIWGEDEVAYTANKLASLTGMRVGEILGLRGEYVYDDHIYVCGQFGKYGYGPTKTKESDKAEWFRLCVFPKRGAKPVSGRHLYNRFHRALTRIGIPRAEIARRGLSFHSWRHFLNTELQVMDVPLVKVQSVTGHKSDRMREWYSHFDAKEFSEVAAAQETLLRNTRENGRRAAVPEKDKPAKKTTSSARGRKAIPFPVKKGKGA